MAAEMKRDLYKVILNELDWKDTYLLVKWANLEDMDNSWVRSIGYGEFDGLDDGDDSELFKAWEMTLVIDDPQDRDRPLEQILTHDLVVEGLYRTAGSDEDHEMRGRLIKAMITPEEHRDEVGTEDMAAVLQHVFFRKMAY